MKIRSLILAVVLACLPSCTAPGTAPPPGALIAPAATYAASKYLAKGKTAEAWQARATRLEVVRYTVADANSHGGSAATLAPILSQFVKDDPEIELVTSVIVLYLPASTAAPNNAAVTALTDGIAAALSRGNPYLSGK